MPADSETPHRPLVYLIDHSWSTPGANPLQRSIQRSGNESPHVMIRFDYHLWRRFRAIAFPYWFREEKKSARGLLVLLLVLLLGQTGFAVLFNQLTGEFTSALAVKDADENSLYKQLAASSTTLISTGHRPSIKKFHAQVLELTGDGKWQLHAAGDYRFSS